MGHIESGTRKMSIETVKANNEAQYDKYITIIRALAEISDSL